MEITSSRTNGILAIAPSGRLDAFGATRLDEELQKLVAQSDIFVVLDLSNVPYLSSGGIRTLLTLQKTLKKRGGEAYLACVAGYPLQVLKMAGFDGLFTLCGSVDQALEKCAAQTAIKASEKDWQNLPLYQKHGAAFHVFQSSGKPAEMSVVGSLMKVLHATLEAEDIRRRTFSDTEYSIGLGALGASIEDTIRLMGEMITIGGTMVWLPTDGNNMPDFLIPRKDTGEVVIYTGLNSALHGEFNDIMLVETKGGQISLSDLYDSIFEIAAERQAPHRSLVAMAAIADIAEVWSSGVKIAPIREFSPADGSMIMAPSNVTKWMDISPAPMHPGRTMVTFGMGLDLKSDLSGLDRNALDNVFYLHPANVGSARMMLHNHGVIFEPLKWHDTLNLDAAIRQVVQKGEFRDMRHLLDKTSVNRAIAGVAYISRITPE